MSRLKIAIENEAVQTVERLYKDLERRIVASPPGICPVDQMCIRDRHMSVSGAAGRRRSPSACSTAYTRDMRS